MATKDTDKSTWAIGGGTLMGIGMGFFFLRQNVFAFVGCILLGIGLGLLVTSILSSRKGQNSIESKNDYI